MVTRQPRLPGVEWHKGDFPREPSAAKAARDYSKSQGMKYTSRGISSVRADPNVVNAVGREVQKQQGVPMHISPQMHASYRALVEHINRQYDYMTKPEHEGGLGISVTATPEDPYANPREVAHDLRTNKRLNVLASGEGYEHPLISAEENDKFRAIHDLFGHMATGRNFSRHGEEAAVQHHSQMFPEEAHPALFSELRGQNAALIRNGDFPENKPYDLPDWAATKKGKPPAPPKTKPEGKQLTMLTRTNRPRKGV